MRVILKLALFFILLLSPTVNADIRSEEETPESQRLLDQLAVEINQTLLKVAEIEQRKGNNLETFHYELTGEVKREGDLGLVIQFIPMKGFLVLDKSPKAIVRTRQIKIGEVITQIGEQTVAIRHRDKAYEILRAGYDMKTLTLKVVDKEKTERVVELTANEGTKFTLSIGRPSEQ